MDRAKNLLRFFLAVALINLPLHYLAYQKFYAEPALRYYPPRLKPHVSPALFAETPYLASTIIVWLISIGIHSNPNRWGETVHCALLHCYFCHPSFLLLGWCSIFPKPRRIVKFYWSPEVQLIKPNATLWIEMEYWWEDGNFCAIVKTNDYYCDPYYDPPLQLGIVFDKNKNNDIYDDGGLILFGHVNPSLNNNVSIGIVHKGIENRPETHPEFTGLVIETNKCPLLPSPYHNYTFSEDTSWQWEIKLGKIEQHILMHVSYYHLAPSWRQAKDFHCVESRSFVYFETII